MEIFYAIDFEICGGIYHFAEKDVVIDGTSYSSGLGALELSKVVDFDQKVKISIISQVNWAYNFSRQAIIDGGKTTVYLVVINGSTVSASEWINGVVSGVSFGDGWKLDFQVSTKSGSVELIPNQMAVINNATWPIDPLQRLPEKSLGKTYPLIIGYPGWVSRNNDCQCVIPIKYGQVSGASVGTAILSDGVVDASQVILVNLADSIPLEVTKLVYTSTDNLGRIFSYVETSSAVDTDEIYVGLKPTTSYGGGVKYKNDVLRGASDIFQYVIERYTKLPLDIGKISVYRDFLNNYKIDAYLDVSVDPISWLSDAVLDHLPVVVARSSNGFYLQPMPRVANKTQSIMKVINGNNAERSGGISPIGDVVNEIKLNWGFRDDVYYSFVLYTSEFEGVPFEVINFSNANIIKDQLCKQSQDRFGIKKLDVNLDAFWDEDTVVLIGRDMIMDQCLPNHIITYTLDTSHYQLEPGSIITLTDDDLYLSEILCRVNDVVISSTNIQITVQPLRVANKLI